MCEARNEVSLDSESEAKSFPRTSTLPRVGLSSPAASCRRVVLPEPEGPVIAVIVPTPISSVTPAKAVTGPAGEEYRRVTACSDTAAGCPSEPPLIATTYHLEVPTRNTLDRTRQDLGDPVAKR